VSGGFAGVVSRTITSPLDVVKILAQVGTRETKSGFISSFRNVYQKEGLLAFWKGNAIACLRLFPYNAVQFTAFNKLKVMLADERTGNLSLSNALLAGSAAGIIATVVTYPTGSFHLSLYCR
jgi:solute carrier family 25 protein 43